MKTEVKYLGNTKGELFTSWHYVANTANIPFFLALVEAHYRVTGDLTPGLG